METNEILHTLRERLNAFEKEEKVLGSHTALNERFAGMVIRAGKGLYELADKKPRYKEDTLNSIYKISLFRDDGYLIYTFKSQPRISKTPWPNSSAKADSEGYTWFIVTETEQRIFLEPHEGPLLWDLVYDYGR